MVSPAQPSRSQPSTTASSPETPDGVSNADKPCGPGDVDWDGLLAVARQAATQAYAPYSKFRVGAAAMVDDGRTVSGSNVENVSYGLSLCAECSLVSDLIRSGGGRLVAVAVVSGSGEPCTPCGRCRQVLLEHGGPDCLVNGDGSPRRLHELLPGGFNPDRLAEG